MRQLMCASILLLPAHPSPFSRPSPHPSSLNRRCRAAGGGPGAAGGGGPLPDTAETVYISSLALLKMLKHGACAVSTLPHFLLSRAHPAPTHPLPRRAPRAPTGRAGIPMEVMGLMLGETVDDYTVRVVDVFAMPQAGSSVTVEAVDPVYQKDFMDMLAQTGRPEVVVGWYHSHPGFGCWLSGTDVNTANSFEQLNPRCVSVVVDPIQSVKGKVVIDAFRCIPKAVMMTGGEPRQTTSVVGSLSRPSVVQIINGLGRHYYALALSFRKNALETRMLMNLNKRAWSAGLRQPAFEEAVKEGGAALADIATHAAAYAGRVAEEGDKSATQLAVEGAGKVDSKRRLEAGCSALMASALAQTLGLSLGTAIF